MTLYSPFTALDKRLPVVMPDCYVVGISGGCGGDCPVLAAGECPDQAEMQGELKTMDLDFLQAKPGDQVLLLGGDYLHARQLVAKKVIPLCVSVDRDLCEYLGERGILYWRGDFANTDRFPGQANFLGSTNEQDQLAPKEYRLICGRVTSPWQLHRALALLAAGGRMLVSMTAVLLKQGDRDEVVRAGGIVVDSSKGQIEIRIGDKAV